MAEPVSGRRQPVVGAPAGDQTQMLEDHAALELLANGSLEVEGRVVEASNVTLYCSSESPGHPGHLRLKADDGERPLWDFPPGTLAGREVAAYAVSRAVGWGIAPPTIMRGGPSGPGMCQLWIDADATTDLIALLRRSDHPQLRDMAVFDAVVSNADGKIRHRCRCPTGGCSAAITVCLGEEYKLWIVLWQWRGRRLPGRALQALAWAARGAGLGRSGGRTSRAAVPGQGTGRATALDC